MSGTPHPAAGDGLPPPAQMPHVPAADVASPPGRKGGARAGGQLLLGITMTFLLGAWAFRDVDWRAMWGSLAAAEWRWLVPHVVIVTAVHVIRALRYGLLLSRMERLPFRLLNDVMAVGNMLLTVLPLRLGELARPVLVARRSRLTASAALAAVTFERVLDGLAMALLLEVLVPFVPETAPGRAVLVGLAHALLAAFAGLLLALLVASRAQRQAEWLIRKALGTWAPGLAERVARRMADFLSGMRMLPKGPQLAGTLLLTVANWVGYGVGIWVLAQAFSGEQGGFPFGLVQGLLVLTASAFAGFIPAAPGQAGTFHAAVSFALLLFYPASVVNGVGLAFTNTLWLVSIVHLVGLGMICMVSGHFSLSEAGVGRVPSPGAAKAPARLGSDDVKA